MTRISAEEMSKRQAAGAAGCSFTVTDAMRKKLTAYNVTAIRAAAIKYDVDYVCLKDVDGTRVHVAGVSVSVDLMCTVIENNLRFKFERARPARDFNHTETMCTLFER